MAKASTKSRALAPAGGRGVTSASNSKMPAFMKDKGGRGAEAIREKDMEIPRVYVLSNVHDEVNNHDDAEPGMIWHNALDKALAGPEGVPFVPVSIRKRALVWRPRGDGGGILARCDGDPDVEGAKWSPSEKEFTVNLGKNGKPPTVKWNTGKSVAESGLLEWGTSDPNDNDSQPAGTMMYEILAAFPTMPEIGMAVITLQRSGVRPAKKWLTNVRMSGAPIYGLQYIFGSVVEQGPEGPFHNVKLTPDGFVEDETLYKSLEALYERYSREGFRAKGEDEGGGRAAGGGATEPKKKGSY